MRINPLCGPLLAVLLLPFAIGITDAADFGISDGNDGTTPVKAACVNCRVDVSLEKQKSVQDIGCGFSTGGTAPFSIFSGYCQRFQCQNGYYYTFSGWAPTGRCEDHLEEDTGCPSGSCNK